MIYLLNGENVSRETALSYAVGYAKDKGVNGNLERMLFENAELSKYPHAAFARMDIEFLTPGLMMKAGGS
jgi:hypothetical protein